MVRLLVLTALSARMKALAEDGATVAMLSSCGIRAAIIGTDHTVGLPWNLCRSFHPGSLRPDTPWLRKMLAGRLWRQPWLQIPIVLYTGDKCISGVLWAIHRRLTQGL